MLHLAPPFDLHALDAFVALVGPRRWAARMAEIGCHVASGQRVGQAIRQRHAIELAIDRLRRPLTRPPSVAELRVAGLAGSAVSLGRYLSLSGRERFRERLMAALERDGTLVSVFHLLRTAALQTSRGFQVRFSGLEDAASYDLLLEREGAEAEIVCDVVSAEQGRSVHRAAWCRLVDRVERELMEWLLAHPGRYLLKITLPLGLQGGLHVCQADDEMLGNVHQRLRGMFKARRRSHHDEVVVLRLDPLALASARVDEPRLLPWLRWEFGPEAHLSVIGSGGSVFVMAARAGRADEIASAIRHRLAAIAPQRLTGTRPGILAMFVEDTDRDEWRGLRDRLELEGEARQFLTHAAARPVIAVTCASRFELFGAPVPDAAEGGELRFRNPAHPAAQVLALAPAVLSSV